MALASTPHSSSPPFSYSFVLPLPFPLRLIRLGIGIGPIGILFVLLAATTAVSTSAHVSTAAGTILEVETTKTGTTSSEPAPTTTGTASSKPIGQQVIGEGEDDNPDCCNVKGKNSNGLPYCWIVKQISEISPKISHLVKVDTVHNRIGVPHLVTVYAKHIFF